MGRKPYPSDLIKVYLVLVGLILRGILLKNGPFVVSEARTPDTHTRPHKHIALVGPF